jgi:hypothetical protein
MARNKSTAIRDFFCADAPHRKKRRLSIPLVLAGAALCLTSAFLMAFNSLREVSDIFRYGLFIGGVLIFAVSALMLFNTILYDFYAIKFLRERMEERLNFAAHLLRDLEREPELHVVGGYSFVPADQALLPASEHGEIDGYLVRAEGKKGFLANAYEVHVFVIEGEELTILSNRTLLNSVDKGSFFSRTIALGDLASVELREELLPVVSTGKRRGRQEQALYRYMELCTTKGERILASLSYYDPIDERKELSFESQVVALKELIITAD